MGHACYASRPRQCYATGLGEDIGPLACFIFSQFSEYIQMLAKFKNLCRIHLTQKAMKQILLDRSGSVLRYKNIK
jgi:hypothetical protein